MTSPDPTSTSPSTSRRRPSQTPPEGEAAPPPLFSQPQGQPPTSTPPASPYDVPDYGPASLPGDAMPDLPTPMGTGSSPEFSAADRRQLKVTLRKALDAFGRSLNKLATLDELEQDAGLYLLDDDDTEGLADPLANVIGRRGGLGAAANPDINDAIRGAIALFAYIARQLSLRRDIRRARAGDLPEPLDEQAA